MNAYKVYQTWFMLKISYALAAILLGLDKCFTSGLIVDWTRYLSPLLLTNVPLAVPHILLIVGIIEIVSGILVWFHPRFGGYVVAAWMIAIIINLATFNAFYDIIARDVLITIGALALAWLSEALYQ